MLVKIIDKVAPPKSKKKEKKYWDIQGVKIALDTFMASPICFHVFMALNIGLRQGNICDLTVNDIDFKKNVISVNKALQWVDK